MGLIQIQIPEQNFELITTAIGSILKLELAGQTYNVVLVFCQERVVVFNTKVLW